MSIHKLTAGSGYDYLTRQVAALDATDKGHVGLASYYTERGETPGVWMGSGIAGIEGLDAGDVVTADQMQSLFGSGHHPLATQRLAELDSQARVIAQQHAKDRAQDGTLGSSDRSQKRRAPAAISEAQRREAARLGVPFKVYDNDVSAFRIEVALRIEAVNEAAGLPRDWPIPATERSKIRTEVARDFFRAEHGRDPVDARELAATIAKNSRPKTAAVAGYDLTFSPVKSVSTLWAVADRPLAAKIELAHQAAVGDALAFLEKHAMFTRTGANGVRQVDVQGLVATGFTHRDSRSGDPDLHTHVAVANKVQTLSPDGAGKWLSIDGRVLFKATVAASETYNTALEKHLGDTLGVRFETRVESGISHDARKRPVREIVGVDPALNRRWSARRASIEIRRSELASAFQATHGRPPTPVEALQLAQQATLETREAKHEPRTLGEQREAWHTQAVEVLGGGERGEAAMQQMVRTALSPSTPSRRAPTPDARWFEQASTRALTAMEERRSTWQTWHVRAEAQRQVRSADLTGMSSDQVDQLVDLVVEEVLGARSVSLARPADLPEGVLEPAQLRRADGASVYTVAGADLFTSPTVLAAEQRVLAAAGRVDGHRIEDRCVDLALLESAANGVALNAGQTTLVRQMATSGARVQLAIAPAGSGKTTTMHALSGAWAEGGGTVIGLAPSAAAASQLRDSMGEHAGEHAQADTLAKLTWSIDHQDLPGWAEKIGPKTLVVIDEAGMADTLSLDKVVGFVLARGGSIRLIGDDQQLAAIGAGGVLRDIAATHGALHLTELMRFTDPAEGAASLALREGRTEALGYYLDRERLHVGDLATMTEDVFGAWRSDRSQGLDSIMLAPTRDLVSELNQRARAHRLDGASPTTVGATRRLADGNEASAGDLIITRANNRLLRTSRSDWVKNGDRWSVLEVGTQGDLTVQHTQHGRTVRLPAEYVGESTELGYAATIHTAQGVTADTMHGLAGGGESRQQLYTMLTRGRLGNHVYLEVVGDGDPHSVIRPDMVRPETPTDLLEKILARDEAPASATGLVRAQADPAARLGEAAARYLDALSVAAEDVAGTTLVDAMDEAAEAIKTGLTEEAAWPALRAHLLLLAAAGEDPSAQLQAAAATDELDSARDTAAVLDWRLDDTGLRSSGAGPLPWVPAIPSSLREHPQWGIYLAARSDLVADLATRVHTRALDRSGSAADHEARHQPQHEPQHEPKHDPVHGPVTPQWARNGTLPGPETIADVEVWRAALQVDPTDRRPTGAPQLQKAQGGWQRHLNRRITGDLTPALREWGHLLRTLAPAVHHDDFTPQLAERLAAMSRAGVDAHSLLRRAATSGGDLPDDHAAAALWWRISGRISPAVAARIDDDHTLTTPWSPRLADLLGADRAERVQASPWWPTLVTVVDHALHRGWQLETLLAPSLSAAAVGSHTGDQTDNQADNEADQSDPAGDVDACQAMVWRASVALDPIPAEAHDHEPDYPDDEAPPEDMWEGVALPEDAMFVDHPTGDPNASPDPWADQGSDINRPEEADMTITPTPHENLDDLLEDLVDVVDRDLRAAALSRDADRLPLAPSEADLTRIYDREAEWNSSPVPRARMLEVNEMAQDYFARRLPGSWGQAHLVDRFGVDLAGHEHFRPGQAPAGWTSLTQHLCDRGVSDEELLATGLASTARTGRLIDRFRDRLMFPITHTGGNGVEILGFVGRRHPDLTDIDPDTGQRSTKAGPKYLNTADTPLFHKGAQLFGAVSELFEVGAVPVVVEGPMDAIAVTLATAGTHVGVAPLGTSLTEDQAAQLATICRPDATDPGRNPVVATDPDLAGQVAAERAFWMLAPHGLDPGFVHLPAGTDPADLLARRGPAALAAAVATPTPLGERLVTERLDNLPADAALGAGTRVIAARPPAAWDDDVARVAARLQFPDAVVREDLQDAVTTWDRDPRKAAQQSLQTIHHTRERLAAAEAKAPAERWAPLGAQLDARLPDEPDWGAAATIMQDAHDQGHDVAAAARALLDEAPLGDRPAQSLRYRLVTRLDVQIPEFDETPALTEGPETRPDPGSASPGAAHKRRQAPAPESDPRPGSQRR
ncbi:MAG: MobF family relaxase [Nocardioides sp.]